MEYPSVNQVEEPLPTVEPEADLPPALGDAGAFVHEELLVEEISIDGMCGVY